MRWRNSLQRNEQEVVFTAKDLVNMDTSKISELELKIMIIKIVAGLETSIDSTRDSLTTDIKELISTQAHIRNVITEL